MVYLFITHFTDGESRKEKDHDLKMMMKALEGKYAALQIVPVIGKLGNQKVVYNVTTSCVVCFSIEGVFS